MKTRRDRMQNERITMKVDAGGYEKIEFADLKKDDLFLLFNPDLTPVTFNDKTIFIALSDAYINNQGVGEIHMTDYSPEVLH